MSAVTYYWWIRARGWVNNKSRKKQRSAQIRFMSAVTCKKQRSAQIRFMSVVTYYWWIRARGWVNNKSCKKLRSVQVRFMSAVTYYWWLIIRSNKGQLKKGSYIIPVAYYWGILNENFNSKTKVSSTRITKYTKGYYWRWDYKLPGQVNKDNLK